MRPSPYETAVLAFLADGKPRTHREISDACGCRNASRVVGKMQRAIRVRREAVKLIKSTHGTGRNLVVTWQIIGPSKERQRLIDKGVEAGILFCSKTKIHGLEGNRNAAILNEENVSEERVTAPINGKTHARNDRHPRKAECRVVCPGGAWAMDRGEGAGAWVGKGAEGMKADFISDCGRVTLYHGRWQDLLPLPVDAIITDQPYGTGWIRGGGKKAGEFTRRKEGAEWDVFDLGWMDHAPQRLAAFCPIQGVWDMCQRLATPCVLKYRKSNPAPYGAPVEPIVSSVPLAGEWEREAYNGDNDLHPCQKPLPLMAWLIQELTAEGETVCDPFMGSGSTGVACIRTNRRFVGIERDPAHYATALERIKNELAQGDLFLK